jgi:hypothetical protein
MRRLGREQWKELVAEYEAGGFAQKEIAAKHDVSLATFQFHLYKTRKERRSIRSSESLPTFLPVTVVASPALKARGREATLLEAMFRSGVGLRFAVGTDTRYLAELFAALG